MEFQLAKTYKGVKMNQYNQPYFTLEQKDLYEEYCFNHFSFEDAMDMAKDFFWEHNMTEGLELYLNIGDIDYANAEQCKVLKPRIEERLKKTITPKLKEAYTVLLDYVSRAIEYNTGVWIEF